MNSLRWISVIGVLIGGLLFGGDAEVRMHKGRPTIFLDGKPTALPTYSSVSWSKSHHAASTPAFGRHQMGAYFISWVGEDKLDLTDEQVALILKHDPNARLLVRNGRAESKEWRAKHPDQLVVTEDGKTLPVPSLASRLAWEVQAENSVKVIKAFEARPWSDRIVGYWYGLRVEGSHEPMIREHMLFDHSKLMLSTFREYLRKKYKTDAALQKAYGDKTVTLATIQVPFDKLRKTVPEVSSTLYWQPAVENQGLRDYLDLNADLFHEYFKVVSEKTATATTRKRVLLYDAFKQSMLGWSNWGFFNTRYSRPLAYAELMAGSGHIRIADALDRTTGFHGVITPHDYQVRGVGGVCEPEGIVDSAILRGKYFFCEYDMRSYTNPSEHGAYGMAMDHKEFEAINWRNIATALSRGYNGYWMDLCGHPRGWFASDEIHDTIHRSVQVLKESVDWEHKDVPCIAVIIDDAAVFETNGDGRFFNEALMWEMKMGFSRSGVPYRLYLLEDLALDNFPKHKLFYFPNLFRVDDERMASLKKTVMRDGNVVVWGPGSGISDGTTLSPKHAGRLTGFDFHFMKVNHSRRVHIQKFDHAITAGLKADTIYGSTLAYGPLLYPKTGTRLGLGWTKQGRNWSGLSVLEREGWTSVFTTAVPVPADIWRNLAKLSGTHVYSETNDIVLASENIVALHSIKSGKKVIRLPGRRHVVDVISGKRMGWLKTDTIRFEIDAPETRVFLLK